MPLPKGFKHSKITKVKIAHAILGKKHTEKTKRKISEAQIGEKNHNFGKKLSEEHRKKISNAGIGRKQSEETKRKIGLKNSIALKGRKMPEDVRKKISSSLQREKCYWWKGGISFEPYSLDWNETLKRSIRERDYYTCQVCGMLQSDIAFDVHHIDYNKKNCNPENLITLCHGCHGKTQANRKNWINYFNNL